MPLPRIWRARLSPLLSRRQPVTFINAQVVSSGGVISSSLRVKQAYIADLGGSPHAHDIVVDLNGAFIYPGFINAHEHLALNHLPHLKWQESYTNVAGWIADMRPRLSSEPALQASQSVPMRDRLFIGGLKNLLSGATTVCHHDPWHWSLSCPFPVRLVSQYGWSHSLGIDGESIAQTYRRTPPDWPWIIHAAEGTDQTAGEEFQQLDQLACLGPNTVLVHGLGLDSAQLKQLLATGGALIWCPSSNQFLFHTTADIRPLIASQRVALGSDSRLTGSLDLLSEIQIAWQTQQVDAQTLFRMVTVDAANILRLPHAGQLAPGSLADFIIVPASRPDPFLNLIHTDRSSLRLVMLGGRACIGDEDMSAVFDATQLNPVHVRLDQRHKLLDGWLACRLRFSRLAESDLESV